MPKINPTAAANDAERATVPASMTIVRSKAADAPWVINQPRPMPNAPPNKLKTIDKLTTNLIDLINTYNDFES